MTLEGPQLVLLADDDDAMRSMCAMALRRRGFQVEEHGGGLELLARLRQAVANQVLPHLVISDVQMPGATGLDVLQWIQRSLPQTSVILITAFGDRRTHRRGIELGALAVINKPFAMKELLRCVTDALKVTSAPSQQG